MGIDAQISRGRYTYQSMRVTIATAAEDGIS